MTRKIFLGLAVSAALLASLSCGGGGGGRDTSGDVTVNAPTVAARDGYIWDTFPIRGIANNNVPGILVGDLVNVESRGFVTFNIAALPAPPAVVRAAVLEIELWQISNAPYPLFGSIVIDHVSLAGTLDALDFDSVALDSGFATVSNSPSTGVISIDVRAQIGADQIAGRTESSFRLRFTSPGDSDGLTDSADFNDAENHAASGNTPALTIVYTP